LISFGSTPERLTASFITVPASSAGSMSASEPPKLPIAERAAPSTTTSRLLMLHLLENQIQNNGFAPRKTRITSSSRHLLGLHHFLDFLQALRGPRAQAGHRISLRLAGHLRQILHVGKRLLPGVARHLGLLFRVGQNALGGGGLLHRRLNVLHGLGQHFGLL